MFGRIASALLAAALGSLALLAPPAAAQIKVEGSRLIDGVDGRTGAFTLTYDDFKGSLTYRRTYISSAGNGGLFGFGWGSVFDTRLVQMPDNTIVVLENGNAGATVYGVPSPQDAAVGDARLLAAVNADRLMTPASRAQYLKRLAADPAARARAVEAYGITGAAPLNTSLYIDGKDTVGDEGCRQAPFAMNVGAHPSGRQFARSVCHGKLQEFWPNGRLADYTYGGEDIPRSVDIGHPTGRVMGAGDSLTFNRDGNVLTVTNKAGAWVKYTFAPFKSTVIATLTSGGEAYRYAYDQQDRMTEIIFVDTTSRRIAYDLEGRVAKITGRGGEVATYTYATTGRGCPVISVYRTRPNGTGDGEAYEFDCVRKVIDLNSLGAAKAPSPGRNAVMEAFSRGEPIPPPK
ncbi:MAG: hypothetical protein KKE02_16720 [Alphaproteobacteria bacterium]|nr:hypothetical protein [Alphaproteobacteria bacterium]MBU1516684.1 hypothetical protein [Alphaproteobacteria bacterium]MBU2094440.1 hypothetical protein [Alphaproteobacteria bacterium]MBU2152667.1 hypothetical protein [Alphaproteobacteria bacterium]MBU2306159.1 hypothetical protein [Alphaproteobacteria bacterium]